MVDFTEKEQCGALGMQRRKIAQTNYTLTAPVILLNGIKSIMIYTESFTTTAQQ